VLKKQLCAPTGSHVVRSVVLFGCFSDRVSAHDLLMVGGRSGSSSLFGSRFRSRV